MRIAVVAPSHVPFLLGGGERVWNGLVREINAITPHGADLIKIPAREEGLAELVRSYRAFWSLDLSHFDMVITGKYPAWMIKHPNHVLYLQHRLRGLYDCYPYAVPPRNFEHKDANVRSLQRFLRANPGRHGIDEFFERFERAVQCCGIHHPAFAFPGPISRQVIHYLDGAALEPGSVRRYFAISHTVASRPNYFPRATAAKVVYPPSDLERLRCGDFSHFFTAGRFDHPKRMSLVVKAMRYVRGSIPLKIAGSGPELENVRRLAEGDARIDFLGYVDSDTLVDLYANAIAVPFAPRDEDLGLITLEAMKSGKPVLTCRDSGGPTEFVVSGKNGFVTEPTARALARRMSTLASDTSLARQLGQQAYSSVEHISWAATVRAILSEERRSKSPETLAARAQRKPKLVVTSTYPIHPLIGGGQLRVFHLYRQLTEIFDIEVVALAPHASLHSTVALADGFVETLVPKSDEHESLEGRLTAQVGIPVTDIAAAMHIKKTPAYMKALDRAMQEAEGVILAHPYLYSAVAATDGCKPIFLDAHNAEFVLKKSVLPDTTLGKKLLRVVYDFEKQAVQAADIVTACSLEDARFLAGEYGVDSRRCVIVPNGVDTTNIPFVSGDTRREARELWIQRYLERTGSPLRGLRHLVLFIASWHPPNLQAAARIIQMAPEIPEALFVLAGSHSDPFRRTKLPENVLALGVVPEVLKLALLKIASVGVNPMSAGSGTNLKLVEYFAAGLPAVATEFGARGLEVESGVHLGVVPLNQFAQAIRTTLENATGSARMATLARELAETRYSWRKLGADLRLAFTAKLSEPPRSPDSL